VCPILHTINKLTDRNGKGLDADIRETIAALWLYHFPTTGSCEGHIDWGLPCPWIDISEPEQAGWRDNDDLCAAWKRTNLVQQKRMLELLVDFQRNRDTPFDIRLTIEAFGFGKFRLQCLANNIADVLSPSEKQLKLAQARVEMTNFTEYLKLKWLNTEPTKRS
jgi:hypothetical protein